MTMYSDLIKPTLTGKEVQVILETLIHRQELLMRLKMNEPESGDKYSKSIEQLSYIINKLERAVSKKPVSVNKQAHTKIKSYEQVRLLIVDDNPDFTKPMADIFEDMGFSKVDHTHNGETALTMIRQADPPYSLVICDWKMPKKDGVEVLREIREDPKWKSLPFILISGVKGGEKVRTALELGVNEYMVKPIYPETIMKKIEETLGLNEDAA